MLKALSVVVWCAFVCVHGLEKSRSVGELVITLDRLSPGRNREQLTVGDGWSLDEGERLCDPDVGQVAGYFKLAGQDKKYFFWFFESRGDPENDPVTLWMTGGPGCSSGIALFAENGPCTVNKDGETTTLNPHSWNKHSNMLYIDQPAGTGFSEGTHDAYEAQVAADMDIFLSEFFTKYSKFAKNKFTIFGESYGGHYVPSCAHYIWKQNVAGRQPKINLQAIGVGNGLTDPEIQYQYYAEMAFNSTTAPARVSEQTYRKMLKETPACIEEVKKCNVKGHPKQECVEALNYCNFALVMPYQQSGYNVYDMRHKCEVPPLCYDFSNIDKYLNSKKVQQYLGVSKKWESCNMQVNQDMGGDFMLNYQDQIPDLLENGITVLIYVGDVDYICNYIGNKHFTLAVEWTGQEGFNKASDNEWTVDGKAAGKSRTYNGFTFLQVYQAGHMVPMDQPVAAETLFEMALNGKPFP